MDPLETVASRSGTVYCFHSAARDLEADRPRLSAPRPGLTVRCTTVADQPVVELAGSKVESIAVER